MSHQKKSSEIEIPENLEEITPSWLSSLIGISLSENNFEKIPNAQAGTGFLSQILRVNCERSEDGKPLSLIVKSMPYGDSSNTEFAKNVIAEEGFDYKETEFYSKIIPELVRELPELGPYLCKSYAGFVVEKPIRNSVLILEDLKPLGFYTVNFAGYLPMAQIEASVQFLAKFHYAARAVEAKRKVPWDKVHPFLEDKAKNNPEASAFYGYFQAGFEKLDDFFVKYGSCSPEFRDYFKRLRGREQVFQAVFKTMLNYHQTLIHGDLWSNNLLVLGDGKTIKVIDWQLLGYADPVFDVAVLIVSLLPPEFLSRSTADRLLRLYYDTYSELCFANGMEQLNSRSWESICETFYNPAMAYVFAWFTFAQYPFSLNLPRLVKVYEFLKEEVDFVSYLLTLV